MIRLQDARQQLSMSRQGLDKWIKKLSLQRHRKGHYSYITIEDFERIQEARNELPDNNQKTTNELSDNNNNQKTTNELPDNNQKATNYLDQLAFLQDQLKQSNREKAELHKNHSEQLELLRKQMEHERWSADNQLKEKDKQIGEMQKALNQEQHLHAHSVKQLEETKSQIRLLEAPKDDESWFTEEQLQSWITERNAIQKELETMIN